MIKKEEIKQKVISWFELMTMKYHWLRIKYEFNATRNIFLVSFSPITEIDNSDDFNKDVMEFEDLMNELYRDDAPLFTDDEKLFKLSSNAEVYQYTLNSSIMEK